MTKRSWEDIGYREALESCGAWNAQMLRGRKHRVPYFDSHTNIGQQNCRLHVKTHERCLGVTNGQVYKYPSRRWKKAKRPPGHRNLLDDPYLEMIEDSQSREALERLFEQEEAFASFKEIKDEVGDNDSDDEYISRSVKAKMGRGGKRGPRGRGAKKTGLDRHSARKHTPRIKPPSIDDDYEQLEPQFQCHLCPKKFLHKSALSYHIKQAHACLDGFPPMPHLGVNGHPQINPQMMGHVMRGNLPPPPPLQKMGNPVASPKKEEKHERVVTHGKCETCKNGVEDKAGSDVLLVCIDCKKANHPTCININPPMVKEIAEYDWQCPDCKSCMTCKLAEDDENLLFCDECDRGCHLYCLDPPLDAAPTGAWACQVCQAKGDR